MRATLAGSPTRILLMFGLVLAPSGLAFKLGAVPYHMWVPDVYQGAPTSVTLLIGTAPKLAAFALTLRVLAGALAGVEFDWQGMLIVLALLSMVLGNLAAIAQTSVKRMLAYSAIANMGYILMGFLAADLNGLSAALFYAITYVLTSLVAFGVILGFIYSGSVAGAVYSSIDFPETFILIGPNHTGLGAQVSLMASGEWEIPSGVFRIDEKISYKISMYVPIVTKDTKAHMFEHSLEVQLPFIAYFSKEVKIVPIVILSATVEECKEIGEGIARAVKDIGSSVVIVASSAMSHYVPDDIARRKDGKAIDRILSLDHEGLFEIVGKERISMCGYIPVTTMLYAAEALGAQSARLVKYTTSAEVSGDYEHVVGYAGIVLR